MSKVLDEIEKIQIFIENPKATDSKGRILNDFDKLAFVQQDLTKLQDLIKKDDLRDNGE